MTTEWLAFWNSSHSIYVNTRHKEAYYRLTGPQIAALVPSPAALVLDYGCGEALHAEIVAAAAGKLLLCEASSRVRASIAARVAGNDKIHVVTPEDVDHLPAHSLDFILLHSVAQYLNPKEIEALFALFHKLLKSDGVLVVGDIIPPNVSASTDVSELFRFAAANGFLLAAMGGLIRNTLSNYRRLRSRYGLSRYSEADMRRNLVAAGFTVHRMPRNIGHHHARMAFMARPV